MYGTDFNNGDTDGDTLGDWDEVFTHETSPLLRDTDDGGTDDGLEVTEDSTDPLDPADDICRYPVDVDLDDAAYVATGPNFDPTFMAVHSNILLSAAGPQDYWVDSDGDQTIGDEERISSSITIDLLGPEFEYICSVQFDADNATHVPAPTWTTPDEATLYDAFTIAAGVGTTDCDTLDADVYGDSDIRKVLADLDWGVAFGPIGDLAVGLENQVTEDGGNWEDDWLPYVYGGYISWDGETAIPTNYGFTYDAACGRMRLNSSNQLVPLDAVEAGPFEGPSLRSSDSILSVQFEDVTGIECEGAELDISNPDWEPDLSTTNAAIYAQVRFFGNVTPDGDLTDYFEDIDDDGIQDAQSAKVEVAFADSGFGELCKITYDASGAIPVDVTTLTPTSATGAVGGELLYAWTVDLQNGEGDCDGLSSSFSDSNVETVIDGMPLTIAVGALDTNLTNRGTTDFGTDWADRDADFSLAGYVSVNGTPLYALNYMEFRNTNDCAVIDLDEDPLDADLVFAGASGVANHAFSPYWFFASTYP